MKFFIKRGTECSGEVVEHGYAVLTKNGDEVYITHFFGGHSGYQLAKREVRYPIDSNPTYKMKLENGRYYFVQHGTVYSVKK